MLVQKLFLQHHLIAHHRVTERPQSTSYRRACPELTDINRFHLLSAAATDATDARSTSLYLSLSLTPLLHAAASTASLCPVFFSHILYAHHTTQHTMVERYTVLEPVQWFMCFKYVRTLCPLARPLRKGQHASRLACMTASRPVGTTASRPACMTASIGQHV